MVLTTWKGFSVYDVSDPAAPQRVAQRDVGPHLFNEQPQTNGEILLVSSDAGYRGTLLEPAASGGGVLDIYDVTDPGDPQRIGRYRSQTYDHLWTCVLDCRYAYSGFGTIVDLSDPTAPRRVGAWTEAGNPAPSVYHHIKEVAPGIVLTGSVPMWLLDARTNPTQPTQLAVTDVAVTKPTTMSLTRLHPHSIPARVTWPGAAAPDGELPTGDRLTVMTMETPFTGPCSEESGEVVSLDTAGWDTAGTFTPIDRYRLSTNGVYADGRPPYNAVGCGAYGLATHPDWGDEAGRLAAVTFFEHGLRLLRIDDEGRLTEVGGYLPHAGNSTAVQWLTDDLIYVVDLHRGVDIFRVDVDAAS
jgi:hypothetical protein